MPRSVPSIRHLSTPPPLLLSSPLCATGGYSSWERCGLHCRPFAYGETGFLCWRTGRQRCFKTNGPIGPAPGHGNLFPLSTFVSARGIRERLGRLLAKGHGYSAFLTEQPRVTTCFPVTASTSGTCGSSAWSEPRAHPGPSPGARSVSATSRTDPRAAPNPISSPQQTRQTRTAAGVVARTVSHNRSRSGRGAAKCVANPVTYLKLMQARWQGSLSGGQRTLRPSSGSGTRFRRVGRLIK